MMHVSVYNGLASLNSSLSCSGFENEVVITNPNGEVGNITVKDPIQELFIPQNAYRIDDVTYSCEDGSINFEKKTFDPPQTVGYTFPNTFLVIKLTCVIYLWLETLISTQLFLESWRGLYGWLSISLSEYFVYHRFRWPRCEERIVVGQ